MDWDTQLTNLRDILASLYPSKSEARRIVDEGGLQAGGINFEGSATNMWHNILSAALRQNRVDSLITVVLKEYSEQKELLDAVDRYVEQKRFRALMNELEGKTAIPSPVNAGQPVPSQRSTNSIRSVVGQFALGITIVIAFMALAVIAWDGLKGILGSTMPTDGNTPNVQQQAMPTAATLAAQPTATYTPTPTPTPPIQPTNTPTPADRARPQLVRWGPTLDEAPGICVDGCIAKELFVPWNELRVEVEKKFASLY